MCFFRGRKNSAINDACIRTIGCYVTLQFSKLRKGNTTYGTFIRFFTSVGSYAVRRWSQQRESSVEHGTPTRPFTSMSRRVTLQWSRFRKGSATDGAFIKPFTSVCMYLQWPKFRKGSATQMHLCGLSPVWVLVCNFRFSHRAKTAL